MTRKSLWLLMYTKQKYVSSNAWKTHVFILCATQWTKIKIYLYVTFNKWHFAFDQNIINHIIMWVHILIYLFLHKDYRSHWRISCVCVSVCVWGLFIYGILKLKTLNMYLTKNRNRFIHHCSLPTNYFIIVTSIRYKGEQNIFI